MSTELYDSSVTEESFRNGREERISEYGEPNTLAGFRRLRERLIEEIQDLPDTSTFEVILDVNRSDLLYVDRRIRKLEAEDANRFLDLNRLQIMIQQRDNQIVRLSHIPEGTERYRMERSILDGMNERISELENRLNGPRTVILEEPPVEEEEIITRALREASQEDLSIEERIRRLREYRNQLFAELNRFTVSDLRFARDIDRIDQEITRLEEMFRREQEQFNTFFSQIQRPSIVTAPQTINPRTGRQIMAGGTVHRTLISQLNQGLADLLRQINESPSQSIEQTRLIIRFYRLYRQAQSLGSDNYSGSSSMLSVALNERLEQLRAQIRELSRMLEQSPSQNTVINTMRDLENINQEIREIEEGYQINGPRFIDQPFNLQAENIQQTIIPPTQNQEDELQKQSYETLVKQLYNLPVVLPEFLIINGLRVSFISFEEISQMLNQNQIERYIIEPLLQPWSGPLFNNKPINTILTMYAKNGMTYLVKVKYDPVNNSINQPI